MLHRAARNAYSWWWASHVRTKQSKWLDQNLQDMEEKVEYILKIVDEDGDTFRQRAEMYYRKRPEIVNFVEDAFRGYRALAERYDHLSKELQSANRAIATVYPDRIPFEMDENDNFDVGKFSPCDESNIMFSKKPPAAPKLNIPRVSTGSKKNSKAPTRLMSKKGLLKINVVGDEVDHRVPSSGLDISEALKRIDKLQKEILALQTEKEFVRSSYESGLEKYWDIEKRITQMQAEVSDLQDEFGIGMVMEDDEARTLMMSAAIKSCQDTLNRLQQKQEKAAEDARTEFQKVQEARVKFMRLKEKLTCNETDLQEQLKENELSSPSLERDKMEHEDGSAEQTVHDLEMLHRKIKEDLQSEFGNSLTISKLAEKVDELADKVISLGNTVSSQSAFVKRLRSEANELHMHIQSLEEDKEMLIDGSSGKSEKIRELEEELKRVQSLNQHIRQENNHLESQFVEACCNLDDLSEKLLNVKLDQDDDENRILDTQSTDGSGVGPGKLIQLQEVTTTNNLPEISNVKEVQQETDVLEQDHKLPAHTISSYRQNHKLMVSSDTNREFGVPAMEAMINPGRFNQGNDLNGQLITYPFEANSSERGFNEQHNVTGPCDLFIERDNMRAEGPKGDFVLSSIGNHNDICSSEGQVGHLLDVNRENSESRDAIIPAEGIEMKHAENNGEISGLCTSMSVEESHFRSQSENNSSWKGNLSGQTVIDENAGMEEEKNDVYTNLSSVKSNCRYRHPNPFMQLNDLSVIDPARSISETNQHQEGFSLSENMADPGNILTASRDVEMVENVKEKSSPDLGNDHEPIPKRQSGLMTAQGEVNTDEVGSEEDDQPNWRELFLNGLDDRERILLQEYTSTLRNYKEAKKKLNEVEKKKRASLFQYCVQIKVLKSANAGKDAEIQSLRKKLNLLQENQDETAESKERCTTVTSPHVSDDQSLNRDKKGVEDLSGEETYEPTDSTEESNGLEQPKISHVQEDEAIKVINVDQSPKGSIIEEKIRSDIDDLLEENLDFWMRFSTSCQQIQKFQTTVKDLQGERAKLKEKKNYSSLGSDIRPIYRHLTEIQTELSLWLDHNVVIKDDLENRLSSLSSIQEEISRLSSAGSNEAVNELDDYQAAKFQGEVLNMKQENNKVANELQSGLERVKNLQVEIEKTLRELDDEFDVSLKRQQSRYTSVRSRIPLRSFLFGVKLKKQKKASFFACISPALQKQESDLTASPL